MPRGDGTGPPRGGGGKGRMGGQGLGAGGNCVCPSCGATISHQRGAPCYQINCPKCGTKMVRQ